MVGQNQGRKRPRLLVADTHRAFAEALAARLGAHERIGPVAVAFTLGQVLQMLVTGGYDVAVLGTSLGAAAGADDAVAGRWVAGPHRLIALSDEGDPQALAAALGSGARAWLTKDVTIGELVRAVEVVMAGGMWLPPHLLTAALGSPVQRGPSAQSYVDRLTEREREVLGHLAAGRSRAEIALALSVSPHTVRTHIQNVLKKADAHSTLAALARARHEGHLLDGDAVVGRDRSHLTPLTPPDPT